MKTYPLQLEISGPIAPCLRLVRRGRQVWASLDAMPNAVSCVAPTFSVAKGLIRFNPLRNPSFSPAWGGGEGSEYQIRSEGHALPCEGASNDCCRDVLNQDLLGLTILRR